MGSPAPRSSGTTSSPCSPSATRSWRRTCSATGQSAKPRGDYSLGAYAVGIRDLLIALGHHRVTVVGHSLGGGIALQFAYEYPVFAERLVVVSSGGLGREVHLLLRAATLPGAELVLPLIAHERVLL